MATEQEIADRRRQLELARERLEALQASVVGDKPPSPGLVAGSVDLFSQGITAGFGDEIESGFRSLNPFSEGPFEGATLSDRFRDLQFQQRQRREGFRAENPLIAAAMEIAGGFTQGAGLFNVPGIRALPALPRLAVTGGTEGALFGAGTAREGERLGGAVEGALAGTVFAPIVGGFASVGADIARPVVRRLADTLTNTPQQQAVRLVTRAMLRDQITPVEASDLLRQIGQRGTLADVGENLGDLTRTAASIPSRGKAEATRFLDDRANQQRTDLLQAARTASAVDEIDGSVIDIINGAESASQGAYQQAYRAQIEVSPRLAAILKTPSMQQAMRNAKKKVLDEGFPAEVVDDITDLRFMDMTKRALDDAIGAARRQGKSDTVRILTNLKRDFLSEIDPQVPAYAEARNIYAGEASIRDAAEAGQRVLSSRTPSQTVIEQVADMGQGELQAFRFGVVNGITDMLDSAANVTTVARRFERVPRLQQIMRAAFPSESALRQFLNQAEATAKFAETKNLVIGGSPTARIQASQRAAADDLGVINSVLDVSTGGTTAIARNLKNIIAKEDIDEDVADALIGILLNPKVVPRNIRGATSDKLSEVIVPRLGRGRFAGAVGGAVGSQIEGAPDPRDIVNGRILDLILKDPLDTQVPLNR